MKTIKRIVMIAFAIIFLTTFCSVVKASDYSDYDYYIQNYDVKVIVSEDNIYDITETITCYFNVPKHGIKRAIPLKAEARRNDGSVDKYKVNVTNVDVDNEFTTSRDNGNYVIKIGSASRLVTGEQKYVIKYKYNFGNDHANEYDEFYYNIIGNGWDVPIKNVTFAVNLPKDFEYDYNSFGYSIGGYGTIGNNKGLTSSIDGKTIIGEYSEGLSENEGITIRLQLPEGYFEIQKIKFQVIDFIIIALAVILCIVAYILWNKHGKDEIPVETIEFYPPKDMNSLDVGYAYSGNCDQKDIISLLIYLADKGYLKIEEVEKEGLFKHKKKDFKIIKIKEYDGDNEMERKFFEGLFNGNREVVEKKDLEEKFYTTVNKIRLLTSKKEYKSKYFISNASIVWKVILMILVLLLLIPIKLVNMGAMSISDIIASCIVIGPVFVPVSIYAIVFAEIIKKSKKANIIGPIIGVVTMPILYLLMRFFFEEIFAISDKMFMIDFAVDVLGIIILIIFAVIMKKRTKYGTEVLGKIKGFKTFLETAEKAKLEALVEEDPKYFYNILPYAYVLDVSDKWIKNFESIAIEPPDWYVGYNNTFDMIMFNSFMNDTMKSVSSAMTSSPSSSGGGGSFSSGGGFSGGGVGGGGGSSW